LKDERKERRENMGESREREQRLGKRAEVDRRR
jgi:hypothetical protein